MADETTINLVTGLPATTNLSYGNPLVLSVEVEGGIEPYTYKWYKDSILLEDQISSTYNVSSSVDPNVDNGFYEVVVYDSTSPDPLSVSSSTTVSVTVPDLIVTGVASTYAFTSTQKFEIIATASGGVAPYTYKWSKGTTVITTATGNNLTYSAPLKPSELTASYTLEVKDSRGVAVMKTTSVTVTSPAVTFTTALANKTVTVGKTLTLTSAASGGYGTITYAWYKNNVLIVGQTNASFSKANIVAEDAGTYKVVATDGDGKTSESSSVVTTRPAFIWSIPLSQQTNLQQGVSGSLRVEAFGGVSPYTYQWSKDGVVLPAFKTDTLLVSSNVQLTHAGVYAVKVTDSEGTILNSSTTVAVTELPPLVFITELEDETKSKEKKDLSLSVTVSGGQEPFIYQWYKEDTLLEGETTNSYSIENLTLEDGGIYRVTVTDNQGSSINDSTLVIVEKFISPNLPSWIDPNIEYPKPDDVPTLSPAGNFRHYALSNKFVDGVPMKFFGGVVNNACQTLAFSRNATWKAFYHIDYIYITDYIDENTAVAFYDIEILEDGTKIARFHENGKEHFSKVLNRLTGNVDYSL